MESRMRRLAALVVAVTASGIAPAQAASLKVLATTEDLVSLTREAAETVSRWRLSRKGYQDPHFVEATPASC